MPAVFHTFDRVLSNASYQVVKSETNRINYGVVKFNNEAVFISHNIVLTTKPRAICESHETFKPFFFELD